MVFTWFAATLRQYPEIAIFLVLALGYYFGKFTFRGIGLGVGYCHTAGRCPDRTDRNHDLAAPERRQSSSCSCLLSDTGLGRSSSAASPKTAYRKPSLRQCNAFSACWFRSSSSRWRATTLATPQDFIRGHRPSPPLWASRLMPSTVWVLAPTRPRRLLDSMPIAYAVTYMFGTSDRHSSLRWSDRHCWALICPPLVKTTRTSTVDRRNSAARALPGTGGKCGHSTCSGAAEVAGLRAVQAEALLPDARVFVLRIRRNGVIEEATADTVLREGDVVAVAGTREALTRIIGERAKLVAVSGRETFTKDGGD
jgi:putative transport protein